MSGTLRILQEGRNCYRIAFCRQATFLIDGESYFKALAEALKNACQAVYILGWDFDSRIHLIRGNNHPVAKINLGTFLNSLLQQRPDLHIHILDWDFPMIYAFEREPLPIFRNALQSHRRLHFEMDSCHPFGASQHQKLVVIDDQLAFCGGLDLTNSRWDSQEHLPEDPRRVDNGDSYQPFHDVQMMVEGEVAGILGNVARQRWLKATGKKPVPPSPSSASPWPSSFKPDLEVVRIGIARTLPDHDGEGGVREVESLYLDAIQSARKLIYIENQYFTSDKVGQALAARLKEKDGPEIILVLPKHCSGWLEEGTMGVLRARLIKQLRASDRWNRLGIFYPSRRDFSSEHINLHAKVMVTDDALLRIGSANLNNRSMGLDSECDLALEADGDERIKNKIVHFRNRLLAEHCGVSLKKIEEALARHDSTATAIKNLSGGTRHLAPLEIEVDDLVDGIIPDSELLDPERPISLEKFVNQFAQGVWEEEGKVPSEKTFLSSNGARIIGIIALIAFFFGVWKWTPLCEFLNAEALAEWGRVVREMPLAPLIVILVYVVAGLVVFPVTVLIIATILSFGPVAGFAYALSGSMANAAGTYALGLILGRRTVRKLIGKRLNNLSRRLARKGLLTIITVRILPVAPFSVINVVAGASHIQFRDYFWGTLIGMLPGILALTAAGKGLGELLFAQKPAVSLIPAILLLAAAVSALFIIRRLLKKKNQRKSTESGQP